MKRFLLPIVAGVLALSTTAAADNLLAFPGAEGFGRYTTGGRGGEIYHVTNLNDSGAGSLRDAVSKENRIIVFDVSGTINLTSPLVFKGNNTVLGQTAPGEGIQLYGNRVSFSGANNLIVRYIRFRMGINGPDGADACGVANGTDMIFDHLSVLWGRDENFSVSWDNKNFRPANITIQNSIIGQGLQSHSCGGLIQTIGGVTLYRNLYVENKTRNPKVKGLNQYVNNVVYNWGNGGCYIMSDSEGDSWADIENNYFMKGPWNSSTNPFVRGIETFRYYGAGNYYDENKDGVINGHEMTVDEMKGEQDGTAPYSTWFSSLDALNANITEYNATATEEIQLIPEIVGKMTAAEALAWMPTNVGPSLPAYDEVDQYIIDELLSNGTEGTKNGITTEKQLPHKGTGILSGGVKPLDTDGDGIPDSWETANGLNPNDASDAAKIASNGYANIENYVFTITEAYPYIKKPVNLSVAKQNKESLELAWELNKNTDNGFIVEYSTDGKTYTEGGRTAAGVTSYEITGLTPGTNYTVRVRAFNNDGIYSDYSEAVATETTDDPTLPKLSENPFPTVGSREGIASGITLKWENTTKPYGGEVTYTLYLGTDESALTAIAENLKTTSYKADNLEANKTYYWRVDATNTLGTTEGTVWNFSTSAGGVLFYTDFHTQPAEYGAKWGNNTANTNIINAANTSVTYNGMVIGSGEESLRIIAMPGCYSSDTTKDYGPATADDEGATAHCVQFYTTKAGGYIKTPEVTGPATITVWVGNPGTSANTVKLYTVVNGVETEVQQMTLGAKKRIFKFTYDYLSSGTVAFKLDANGKKVDFNDILIERYVSTGGDLPLELLSGSLDNTNVSYADGSIQLGFNQNITYNGGAEIQGKKSYEEIEVSASGKNLVISHNALDVNSEYSVVLPAGAVTDATGTLSYPATIKITTCDFPEEKLEGDNHYGKAAATLPLNFVPFNETAPFATVGHLVQDKQADYPHWVQASGEINADDVLITNTKDKLMSYFEPQAKYLWLDMEKEGDAGVTVKVLESRNCDVAPGWRTIRVLRAQDFPFNGVFALNPETNFVKLLPESLSSSKIRVKGMRISDADGFFGEDFTGVENVTVGGALKVNTYGNLLSVEGVKAGAAVKVYDLSGRQVGASVAVDGAASFILAKGFYIVEAGGQAVKVKM